MADIKEVNGVFGGVEIGNINDQETTTNYAGGVEGIGANNLQSVGTNLPAKQGFWSKFKAFWLQPVDWKKEIKVELPPYQEKNFITDTENIRRVHGRTGEIISFSGFGWGHGLGLSQWGAKAMAEKFAVNKNGDFKDILNHYYKNIEIKKIY